MALTKQGPLSGLSVIAPFCDRTAYVRRSGPPLMVRIGNIRLGIARVAPCVGLPLTKSR